MTYRLALALEYQGTHYHGFQKQSAVKSVQSVLESALSVMAGHEVKIYCAGRTDKGVHASCQIIHFDTTTDRPELTWVNGTNAHLPADIKVLWAKTVSLDFHARFSAVSRGYFYLILNRPVKPVHFSQGVTWYPYPLDILRMQKAANYLLGTHDFSSFRDRECQAKSPVRTLESIKIYQQGDVIITYLKANAFLHHMVRNIMGVLLPIGAGKQDPDTMLAILKAKRREVAGITAPGNGLYLAEVNYPAVFALPKHQHLPWFITH